MAVGSHSKFTQVNSLVARDPVTPSSGFAHVKMPASRSHFSISCCQHIAHSLEKAVWACVSSAGAFQPKVPALVVQLENTYDVKEIALRAAIKHRGSFRLVHHDTLQKIDVALSAYRAYSQVRQERAQRHALEQGSRAFYVASPEDTILTLLERYNGGVQRFQHLWEAIVVILAV